MPLLPVAKPFAEFLSAIRCEQPEDCTHYRRISWQDCLTDGPWHATAAIDAVVDEALWVRTDVSLTWESFVTRLERGLADCGHAANPVLAWTMAMLFSWLRPTGDPCDRFEQLASHFVEAEVRQIWLFPWVASTKDSASVQGLYFGPSAVALGGHNTSRQSIELDEVLAKAHWCIAAPPRRTQILRFDKWRDHERDHFVQPYNAGKLNGLSAIYAYAISRKFFWEFTRYIIPSYSAILSAYHGELLSFNAMLATPENTEATVAVSKFGQLLWAGTYPSSDALIEPDFRGMVESLKKASERLQRFPIGRFPESLDEGTLSSEAWMLAEFVAWAKEHRRPDNSAEAVALATMGLETVFGGERQSVGDTVARRIAVCCSRLRGEDYESARQEFLSLYNMRSRFAHAGVRGAGSEGAKAADRILEFCDVALEALSQARMAKALVDAGKTGQPRWTSTREWKKYLDYLAAGLEAGLALDEEQFRVAGLFSRVSAAPDAV